MWQCFRTKLAVHQQHWSGQKLSESRLRHADACPRCGKLLQTERTIAALLAAFGGNSNQSLQETELSQDFYFRLRANIRSRREEFIPGWESAVLSLRGWLLGFSLVAVLLLTFSFNLGLTPDNTAANGDDALTFLADSPQSDNLTTTEEFEYGR
jgi:hypothetical protein